MRVSCLCVILVLGFVQFLSAESVESTAESIYQEVLSPFCPGRALQDCPSKAASDLKVEIKQQLQAGNTKEEVLDALYEEYGDSIRAVPRFAGFGIFAWVAPVVFIVVGILVLRSLFFRSKAKTSDIVSQPLSEAERKKIKETIEGGSE